MLFHSLFFLNDQTRLKLFKNWVSKIKVSTHKSKVGSCNNPSAWACYHIYLIYYTLLMLSMCVCGSLEVSRRVTLTFSGWISTSVCVYKFRVSCITNVFIGLYWLCWEILLKKMPHFLLAKFQNQNLMVGTWSGPKIPKKMFLCLPHQVI